MKKRIFLLIFPLALLLCLVAGTSLAETLQVSPEGMSLTEALASCRNGDTILMADGVYSDSREVFPIVVDKSVTIRAEKNSQPVISSPKMLAALRVEADGVSFQGITVDFLRTGIYAVGDNMRLLGCTLRLGDEEWRTSSCGIWCGGIKGMVLDGCSFVGCSVSLAGPPLNENSHLVPVLTGLFEVGEDIEYFTSHTITNTTVNGKPLFYAVNMPAVDVPEGMGEVICANCGSVTIRNADVSDGSMGMVLAYNGNVTVENSRADRCGVFGIYVCKSQNGRVVGCSADATNHGIDIRACSNFLLKDCHATNCDQGLFFSHNTDSAMVDCSVTSTGQGFFTAGGSGSAFINCTAEMCENGFNIQKDGRTLMTGCTARGCTVCGVRLDGTPAEFVGNSLENNWVAVMAYGCVKFNIAGNAFSGSRCVSLYLRDIDFSTIALNTFTLDAGRSVQVTGSMGGSLFLTNSLSTAIDTAKANGEYFSMVE